MTKRGTFLTVEGGDGAGKTTFITLLKEYLESKGEVVLVTREPGGIDIAEQIRTVILDTNNTKMDPRTEALLYAAARRQHLVEKVCPALHEGKIVICDRFIDSSLAYQGYARGIGIDEVWAVNAFAIEDVMPDVTLLLDIDPEAGMARIRANDSREVNRLDLENMSFHYKVREGYYLLKERFDKRIRIIDASRTIDEIVDEAKHIVDDMLSNWQQTKHECKNQDIR